MNRGVLLITIFFFISSVAVCKEKKPRIAGQKSLQTGQGQSITLKLSDFTVTDDNGQPYDGYPAGFSLQVFNGENYTVVDQTVTPDGNFVGMLSVPVRVQIGKEKSNKFDVTIEVTPRQSQNVPPVIIGQVELKTGLDNPITIKLGDLFVNDPDDQYPTGFSLRVASGNNYSVNGNTVTPARGYSGELVVPVTVNDGQANSTPFNLRITVGNRNAVPAITGQSALRTVKDQPLTITLGNLTVNDADNKYPDDFTLAVLGGDNYTVSGTTITPAPGFIGGLTVNVSVSDGRSTSKPFALSVTVVDNARLEIVGQKDLVVQEDETISLTLGDLKVNDPGNNYPSGFQLQVLEGENYTAEGSVITPVANYSGNLQVAVRVASGANESDTFQILVRVVPVNDAPVITGLSETPVGFEPGGEPILIAASLVIEDPDDNRLSMAEVGFETGYFQPGGDVLVPTYNIPEIRAVFDPATGTLFFIGEAPVAEYRQLLRSITYQFNETDSLQPQRTKNIYFSANDGSAISERKIVVLGPKEAVVLDIPTVFTPNDDQANDTWHVKMQKGTEEGPLSVKVYSPTGVLVYEASTLLDEWDGTMGGKVLPADNYYYRIELAGGAVSDLIFQGFVTILH
jgi:gliding motility-associated-like protein